jgi:hypothetical protein
LDLSSYAGVVDLAHLKWIVPNKCGYLRCTLIMFIWKEVATTGSDATLSDLKVSGTTIAGFASATTTYTAELYSWHNYSSTNYSGYN